jgi:hypothetical protein
LEAKGAHEDGGQHDGIASEEGAIFDVSLCAGELDGGVGVVDVRWSPYL